MIKNEIVYKEAVEEKKHPLHISAVDVFLYPVFVEGLSFVSAGLHR